MQNFLKSRCHDVRFIFPGFLIKKKKEKKESVVHMVQVGSISTEEVIVEVSNHFLLNYFYLTFRE